MLLIKTLMNIVYKADHISGVLNLKHLKKFDFNETNAKKRTIFFGCSGQFELDQLKKNDQIDEKTFLDINDSAKIFVVSIIEKLKSRLLVGSSFLHKTTCLNPSMLSTLGKDNILSLLKNLVLQLSQQKIITCNTGDKSLIEFEKLISKKANVVMFDNYDSSIQRLDSFFLTS